MAYRDPDGRAHFTINDEAKVQEFIEQDLCSICGAKLFRARWFIGGPRSAFHEHGAYIDPPMHDECAHYALRVCPYLAIPNYAKLVGDRTLSAADPVVVAKDTRVHPDRPDMFVAVLARGQTVTHRIAAHYIRPHRPYMRAEYWRHGHQLPYAVGETMWRAICEAEGYAAATSRG
jgi:hypothetical protein